MAKRNEVQSKNHRKNTQSSQSQSSQGSQRHGNKGSRSRLKSLSKQCEAMLRIMGVCCVQSSGEAEALCAQLNQLGLVDGCITQDGDCFLYGATTVYRNFTVSAGGTSSSSGYSVDVYKMADARSKLRLTRERLVALSLICGCDYGGGVGGAGKQLARTFLEQLGDEVGVLDRLRRWRTDPYFERLERERVALTTAGVCDKCCHPGKENKHETAGCLGCGLARGCRDNLPQRVLTHKDPEERKAIVAELNLRKKALTDPDFPSQEMIDEFLQERPTPDDLDLDWKEPDLAEFIKYADRLLSWTETYSVQKFLPLVTRWQLTRRHVSVATASVSPERIVKTRVQKGVACYELTWLDNLDLLSSLTLDEGVTVDELLLTVEPQALVADVYPRLVRVFEEEREAAKKAKRKPRATKKTKASVGQGSSDVDNLPRKEPLRQLSLNQFVQAPSDKASNVPDRAKRATGKVPQKRPQVTIASLMRKVQTIEGSKPTNRRADEVMCNPVAKASQKRPQVTIASLMRKVQTIEGRGKSDTANETAAKRYGSPGMKAGLKDRKITRHSSTPKRGSSSVYHLEASFRDMSLVDDLEDLDSCDDISDLSALIDSIVGPGGGEYPLPDAPGANESGPERETTRNDENVPPEFDLSLRGRTSVRRLLDQSLVSEKDEFDISNDDFVPLSERIRI